MGMPRTRLSLLLAVLAVALGLRIGAAFAVQSLLDHHLHRAFLVPGDAEGYWELGQRLVAARGRQEPQSQGRRSWQIKVEATNSM